MLAFVLPHLSASGITKYALIKLYHQACRATTSFSFIIKLAVLPPHSVLSSSLPCYHLIQFYRQACRATTSFSAATNIRVGLLYSGKFSNGTNVRIIRKRAVCAKIKTFEIYILSACGCGLNRVIVYCHVVRTCVLAACDFDKFNFEILF